MSYATELGYAGRHVRPAAVVAGGWGAILLIWAAYNCFGQVGFVTFVQGIFYYGVSDGSSQAETNNLNYAVVYLVSAWLILGGRYWARGVVMGVALVEGYNRLRSLTGALLDAPQREWFTGTVEGWLKLSTFAVGLLVTAGLVVVLGRSFLLADQQRRVEEPMRPAPQFGPPPQSGYGFPGPAQGRPPVQAAPAQAVPEQGWVQQAPPAAPYRPEPDEYPLGQPAPGRSPAE
ncbi:hypothetical protein [Kitasatospora sp. NPDC004289]